MEDKAMYVNYFWFTFHCVLRDVLLAITTYKMTLKTFTCNTFPLTLLSLTLGSLPMTWKGFKRGKIWYVLKSPCLSFPNYMRSHLLRAVAQVWAKQIKNVQQNFGVFSLSNWIYSGIFCSTLWFVWHKRYGWYAQGRRDNALHVSLSIGCNSLIQSP